MVDEGQNPSQKQIEIDDNDDNIQRDTLLSSITYRNLILQELYELESFLDQRLIETYSTGSFDIKA